MILISKIEFMQTEKDVAEIVSKGGMHEATEVLTHAGYEVVQNNILTELVKGVRLHRHDGAEVIIGFSKQAEDVLGLSYEVFHNQEKELNRYFSLAANKQGRINTLKATKLWQRIKFVFTGIYENPNLLDNKGE